MVYRHHAVIEYDVDSVLGFTRNAISGAKIAGGFTDYVTLMVFKQCSR